MAKPPSSMAEKAAKPPASFPMGVRVPASMTEPGMGDLLTDRLPLESKRPPSEMTRSGHSRLERRVRPSTVMIRVVLADDEFSVRAMLGIALGMEDDFTVVGEANNG